MNFITTTAYKVNSAAKTLFDKVYSVYSQLNFTGLWRYNPLREEHKSLEAELSGLKNRYSGDIEEATREIRKDYEKRFQQAISEAEKRISKEKEGQIRGLESRLDQTQYHFDKTKQNYRRIEELYLGNRDLVTEFEKQIASYLNQIKKLEEKAKEHIGYMYMYQVSVQQEEVLKQQVSELDGKILQLSGELQAGRKTLSILKKSHESQSSSFAAERAKNTRLEEQITEYESRLRELENQANYGELYEDSIQKIKSLEQEIEDQKNRILLLAENLQSAKNTHKL